MAVTTALIHQNAFLERRQAPLTCTFIDRREGKPTALKRCRSSGGYLTVDFVVLMNEERTPEMVERDESPHLELISPACSPRCLPHRALRYITYAFEESVENNHDPELAENAEASDLDIELCSPCSSPRSLPHRSLIASQSLDFDAASQRTAATLSSDGSISLGSSLLLPSCGVASLNSTIAEYEDEPHSPNKHAHFDSPSVSPRCWLQGAARCANTTGTTLEPPDGRSPSGSVQTPVAAMPLPTGPVHRSPCKILLAPELETPTLPQLSWPSFLPTLLLVPVFSCLNSPSCLPNVTATTSFSVRAAEATTLVTNSLELEVDSPTLLLDASPAHVTTVMIRNLPANVTQACIMQKLEQSGFKDGSYDFLYMPQSFDTKTNKGFCFINFTEERTAGVFISMWHQMRFFSIDRNQPALNIAPAELQGVEANLKRWATARLRRIKNPDMRPFIWDHHTNRMRSLADAEFGAPAKQGPKRQGPSSGLKAEASQNCRRFAEWQTHLASVSLSEMKSLGRN